MKRLIVISSFAVAALVSSCKKEEIKPNVEERNAPVLFSVPATPPTTAPAPVGDGGITDPNNDDYSPKRPNKKN
ncbi:MAG TPA: hypothetical protein VKZ44_03025 [Taishania sp.]|nr:hypothetical protein [Taishania sp.]